MAGAGGGVGGGARVCGRTLGWRPWSSHTPKTNSRGRGGGRGDSAENLVKSLFDRIQGGLFEAGKQAEMHFILYPGQITVKSASILESVSASN